MTDNYSEQRRDFLKTITILGGAAISLTVLKEKGNAGKKLPSPQPQSSAQSYRETEHIRKYYETARS